MLTPCVGELEDIEKIKKDEDVADIIVGRSSFVLLENNLVRVGLVL